ncbi:MAG: hypothetical protein FWB80_07590 [Defluviitaleaceae bacterium]|nr:hypothetical protein [Defluviitaleaceae bacterium]
MRDLHTRLKKIEAVQGARPIHVTFTDVRGVETRMSLDTLQYLLRKQIGYIQYELGVYENSNAVPLSEYIIPDKELHPLAMQVADKAKMTKGETRRHALHVFNGLVYLWRGYFRMGDGRIYSIAGKPVDGNFTDDELLTFTMFMQIVRENIEEEMHGDGKKA